MATGSQASYGFPYSYISCSCAQESLTANPETSHTAQVQDEEDAETEQTFNPRDPRANFALYPLEHLMWCDHCHDIRCARCTTEEIVSWYCPNCMFEVASGMVKSEGNRCTRNCHNCPVCTSPMMVNSLDTEAGGMAGPWILGCDYCGWTTRDIDVHFDKPNNIFGQLAKIFGESSSSSATKIERQRAARSTTYDPEDDEEGESKPAPPKDHDSRFKAMRNCYAQQLAKASSADPLVGDPGSLPDYSSPSSLSRIMALYTGTTTYGKSSPKPVTIRAAFAPEEGVKIFSKDEDLAVVRKLRNAGWEGTTDQEQRFNQTRSNVQFIDDLRPVPVLLRTKRSRRCRTCRHILVRPEAKVSSVRYRIKLVAMNYVPALSISLLQSSATAPATVPPPDIASTEKAASLDLHSLPPSRPLQFILTVRNPMFYPIKVTLATSNEVPGMPGSRVTILCPQFDVSANSDVWAEALAAGNPNEVRKSGPGESIAEAGKIWERGRNWTAVVLELVGPRLRKDDLPSTQDDDILEVPVYFRIEYEADTEAKDKGNLEDGERAGKEGKKEKRELAYWCILGVGKMARVDA